MLTRTDLLIIAGVARGFTLALLVSKAVVQALFDLDTLCLLKLVLLLEGVVGDDFVVDAIVQLAIIVELILPVDLPALLAKAKNLLLDLHLVHDLAASLT